MTSLRSLDHYCERKRRGSRCPRQPSPKRWSKWGGDITCTGRKDAPRGNRSRSSFGTVFCRAIYILALCRVPVRTPHIRPSWPKNLQQWAQRSSPHSSRNMSTRSMPSPNLGRKLRPHNPPLPNTPLCKSCASFGVSMPLAWEYLWVECTLGTVEVQLATLLRMRVSIFELIHMMKNLRGRRFHPAIRHRTRCERQYCPGRKVHISLVWNELCRTGGTPGRVALYHRPIWPAHRNVVCHFLHAHRELSSYDWYNRSKLTYVQAIILEIVAKDWKVYLVAKLFSGFSAAFLGTGVMTYMSEIAITQIRGAMLGAFSFSFALGQLFSAVGLQILNEVSVSLHIHLRC